MQELRILLPAATVLFGFLLSVPFSNGASDLTPTGRLCWFLSFISAAVALTLLLGEVGYHRIRGRPYDKRVMLRTAARQAVVALCLLCVSLSASVVLVTDLVYGNDVVLYVVLPIGVLALWSWFGLPLLRRFRGDPPTPPE